MKVKNWSITERAKDAPLDSLTLRISEIDSKRDAKELLADLERVVDGNEKLG